MQRHPVVLLSVALALVAPSCSATRQAAGRGAPVAPGVALEDRAAITDLIHRYSYTWDGRDVAGWVGLFTDDAVIQAAFVGKQAWSYGSNTERRTFIDGFYEAMAKQGLVTTRHVQAGTLLTPESDGSVRGETMFVVAFQFRGEKTPRFTNTGVYRDRFVRTPTGWKFARRDIDVDQEG
ncbi:MAG: nuclear transport factor 2 family protein [Deltaproteobacteria bacterium]|nr:nuclear transport factor 2 family protein [Deltaproteobacteria bacterium]